MIHLASDKDELRLDDSNGVLLAAHKSMLAFWGFEPHSPTHYICRCNKIGPKLQKLLSYFSAKGFSITLDETLENLQSQIRAAHLEVHAAATIGLGIKAGRLPEQSGQIFLDYTRARLARTLLPHQEKAALHLASIPHGANFSVPGAGKSSVVLAVFAWLRAQNMIRSLFIVGPRSCFAPWQYEYEATLGSKPNVRIIAGGNVMERHFNYYPPSSDIADLYLTTYQTLSRDVEHARALFVHQDNQVMFVADEAHYIRQEGGTWAESVLEISHLATKRCVLTGTPFPHSYGDAINIFESLYPQGAVISDAESSKIRRASLRNNHDEARAILEPAIAPLFYRVRKQDLGLSDPRFLPPITVALKPIERNLYESIVQRIRALALEDYRRDFETIQSLRKGRLMRLRQVLSYSRLLSSAIQNYTEDAIGENESLAQQIASYDELEIPGKIDALLSEVRKLQEKGEKVVIWSNFVGTLELILHHCAEGHGWRAKIVCGRTPTLADAGEETREEIIEEFKDSESGLNILIANPAACAESISLHKTCSHAIYYDLSYNCAEYLQSLDRIHRVGGSENKVSYYHYLRYEETIEPTILENLLGKAERMYQVIDSDFPLCTTNLEDMEEVAYDEILK